MINVFAQQLDERLVPKGMSSFAVPQGAPGLRHGPEALTMGVRGMVQNAIDFDGVPVARARVLGSVGAGMEVAEDAMSYARLAITAVSVGGMKRCAQLMVRYARRRPISTGRLLDNPATLARLSEIIAAATAVESLVEVVGDLLDHGRAVPVEAYTAGKATGPELLWVAADHLVQCLGGRGYVETNVAPQILRDARIGRIFEGPTETMRMFLGSRLAKRGDVARSFLRDDLGAPGVADELAEIVGRVTAQVRNGRAPFHDRLQATRWSYLTLGEIGALVLLRACAERQLARSGGASYERAAAWARARADATLARALEGELAGPLPLDGEALERHVGAYAATIGDVEPTLAGENHDLDDLLRRDDAPPPARGRSIVALAAPAKAPKIAPEPSAGALRTAEEIEGWLADWLSRRLSLPLDRIDPTKAFTTFGLDSTDALTLAHDLEARLGVPIEATIAWSFPTIGALAAHLADEAREARRTPPRQSVVVPRSSDAASVNGLSEAEAEEMLLEELLR